MKVAISANGTERESRVDSRFGRCSHFIMMDTECSAWEAIPNTQNLNAASGAGIQAAATVVNAGCGACITGHCGPKAFATLAAGDVDVYTVSGGTVRDAFDAFCAGSLKKLDTADVAGHW